ncbi:MAG: hydantoinase/oxoprolinase family protein [Hyphomicrobiaceae bacterium]
MFWVGVDVGGTFTDLVLYNEMTREIVVAKTPTTPLDQSRGILAGLEDMRVDPAHLVRIAHGSTVATNTALERSGAQIATLVTRGHRDIFITGRGNRTLMYNIKARAPEPLLQRDRCFEIPERIDAQGNVILPLDEAAVEEAARALAAQNCEAIAICYLHSYAAPQHERRTAEILARELPSTVIAMSAEVLPEYREHERFSTTALNVYVAPRMRRYLGALRSRLADRGCTAEVTIMTSSGGTLPDKRIEALPALSMLSGPAAGVIAAQFVGAAAGFENVITCDMGGTSTDVCLIQQGTFSMTGMGRVGRFPVKFQQMDINTVGADGGSIATYEVGGVLRVGPRSAGAEPGPAAYGRGGTEPTVTDANVILGRLQSEEQHSHLVLYSDRAQSSVDTLARQVGLETHAMAEGITRIAVVNMTAAIKEISIMQGLDPRDFALMAYGGAGPLHATAIADELGMGRVLVPPMPANFSAFGLLVADLRRDFVRTHVTATADTSHVSVNEILNELLSDGRGELEAAGVPPDRQRFESRLDMRYIGQAFELSVPIPLDFTSMDEIDVAFRKVYAGRYGDAPDGGSEIVNYRVTAWGVTNKPALPTLSSADRAREDAHTGVRLVVFDGESISTNIYRRNAMPLDETIDGPALIQEASSVTVVPPAWSARLTTNDCIVLERKP